jgi:hypothetical protein
MWIGALMAIALIMGPVLSGAAIARAQTPGPTAERASNQTPDPYGRQYDTRSANQSSNPQRPDDPGRDDPGRNERLVELGGIVDSPERFRDQTVVVRGTINEIMGPRTLTIAEGTGVLDRLFPGDTLLVVGKYGPAPTRGAAFTETFDPKAEVQVVGQVHIFNQAAFEDHLGFRLGQNYGETWGGRAAIIAEAIQPLGDDLDRGQPGDRGMYPGPAEIAGVRSTGSMPAAPMTVALNVLAENPRAYDGQTVTVTGIVASTHGARVFVLEDNDLLFNEEMLVITARPMQDRHGNVFPERWLIDEPVRVTGTIDRFTPAEVERQLGADLPRVDLRGWKGRLAITARSVERDRTR